MPRKMKRRKQRRSPGPKKEPGVKKLPPDVAAARDEGPRLIPLPDSKVPYPLSPGLPTDSSVALADLAMRLWDKAERKNTKTDPKRR